MPQPRSLSSAKTEAAPGHAPDLLVDEVAGPPFSLVEASAAIALGVIALLMSGMMGLLLAGLAEEGRLSAPGIGLTATLEALSTALVTGAAGVVLRPVRLRAIALAATAVLIALDLATTRTSGSGVMVMRGVAGIPEGILLWISIGFIARTATPERWAAVLFTGIGLSQLALATGLSALILPRFAANGGYVAVAAAVVLALPVALFLPSRLGPTTATNAEASGAPPLRGWVALGGTLCLAASLTAVSVYIIPLAHQAGLSTAAGRSAISVALACQMAGGALATWLAGRLRYITVFWGCAAVFFATWAVYAFHAPAWLFVAMSGLAGLASFVAGPFLVPMTIEADPSRRAAMQSGAVQLLAGAAGPLLASLSVTNENVHGALILAVALQGAGLAVATILHRSAKPDVIAISA